MREVLYLPPRQDGVLHAHTFLENPPERLVPFWAGLSSIWDGPGPPAVRTGGRQLVYGLLQAACHQAGQ